MYVDADTAKMKTAGASTLAATPRLRPLSDASSPRIGEPPLSPPITATAA